MDFTEAPARLRALPSYAITLTAAQAGQLATDLVARLGASKAAYGMLAVLEEFGPSSQADLGRRLGMDRRSVSDETAGLERGGLVSREPDPADPRRNRLEITEAGRALLAELEDSFKAMQDELFAMLSTKDRAELNRLLSLMVASASASAPTPAPAPARPGRGR
ncbi:MarR family winged helix-turn-helix transcriptional regulator [Catenulispora pinisilvae]|uniref:MarR family winged helix-turn-helix transcriptional regulator n=1 Tax=Catenulispora pinisilvae TaxID=2705253 RepID=UPI00189142BF|nr:MarR family winged helix-turn-helix transcriptional regulator [Catenulispora pinisilvae]